MSNNAVGVRNSPGVLNSPRALKNFFLARNHWFLDTAVSRCNDSDILCRTIDDFYAAVDIAFFDCGYDHVEANYDLLVYLRGLSIPNRFVELALRSGLIPDQVRTILAKFYANMDFELGAFTTVHFMFETVSLPLQSENGMIRQSFKPNWFDFIGHEDVACFSNIVMGLQLMFQFVSENDNVKTNAKAKVWTRSFDLDGKLNKIEASYFSLDSSVKQYSTTVDLPPACLWRTQLRQNVFASFEVLGSVHSLGNCDFGSVKISLKAMLLDPMHYPFE